MKKVALLVFGVLALASCAPSLTPSGAKDPDRTAGFNAIGNPPVIWFKAGASDIIDLFITIKGSDLRLNAPTWCKANGADVLCTVPSLPAGKNFVLPMKGSNISAVAEYKRAGVQHRVEVRQ